MDKLNGRGKKPVKISNTPAITSFFKKDISPKKLLEDQENINLNDP
jgi:hypothetical protein